MYEEQIFIRVIGQPGIIFDTILLNESIAPDSSFNVKLILKNVGRDC